MPSGTTPRVAGAPALLVGLTVALLAGGVGLAGPAAAVDDPARPDARVTHGPSCRPGGVVVEVTAGTVPYAVVLATTRTPDGEDSAELQPGQTVELTTADVGWGEMIDSRLEYTALDGSGISYVDELEGFEFTRPAEEDCAAIAPPTAPATVPPSAAPPPGEADVTEGSAVPMPEAGDVPVPPGGAPADEGGPVLSADTAAVAAGGVVTLTASGFVAGERVVFRLVDGTELGTATAGSDGSVRADVQIPAGTTAGPATVEVVGATSEAAVAVDLRIAAAETPLLSAGTPWPRLLAGIGLLAVSGGILVGLLRRRPAPPDAPASGSA
ncbi:hypothetical protein [Blastococcus sp. SYSU D00820]